MSLSATLCDIPHELGKRVKPNPDDPRSLFELGECIGEGTYGEVREAKVKKSGELLLDILPVPCLSSFS